MKKSVVATHEILSAVDRVTTQRFFAQCRQPPQSRTVRVRQPWPASTGRSACLAYPQLGLHDNAPTGETDRQTHTNIRRSIDTDTQEQLGTTPTTFSQSISQSVTGRWEEALRTFTCSLVLAEWLTDACLILARLSCRAFCTEVVYS